jgi:hypothetical protein
MGANILARSLFETALATLFILRPHVPVVVAPSLEKGGTPKMEKDGVTPVYSARARGRKTKALKCANRELRANLYYLHSILSEPKLFQRMADIPGVKRYGKAATKRIEKAFRPLVDQRKTDIGCKWWSVLNNHPHTYSGLNVAEMAKTLSRALDRWYRTIYHVQSGVAHSASTLNCLRLDEITDSVLPNFFSHVDETRGVLNAGVAVFLICIGTWQNHIPFSGGTKMVVESLITEFHRVFN